MKHWYNKEDKNPLQLEAILCIVILALSVISLLRSISIKCKLNKALNIYIKNNKPPKKQKKNTIEDDMIF